MSFDTTALPAPLPGPASAGSVMAEPRDVPASQTANQSANPGAAQDSRAGPSAFEQMLAAAGTDAAKTDAGKTETLPADTVATGQDADQPKVAVQGAVVLIQAQTSPTTERTDSPEAAKTEAAKPETVKGETPNTEPPKTEAVAADPAQTVVVPPAMPDMPQAVPPVLPQPAPVQAATQVGAQASAPKDKPEKTADTPADAAIVEPADAQAVLSDAVVNLLALAGQAPQPAPKPAQASAANASQTPQQQASAKPDALPLPAMPSDVSAADSSSAVTAAKDLAKDLGTADFAGLLATLDQTGTPDVPQPAVTREVPLAQGFSLVANTDSQVSGNQAPAYTPPAPNTSLLSQSAVDNLNALSVQINKRLSEGNTKFAMELHPADLGRVDVALTITKNGQMSAHLSFDTPVTAEVFAQHETELRHQLAQTGLQLADDALTFSSRVKPVETAVVTHTNTENRSQDSLSQNGQQNNQHNSQQAQAQLNDQQGRPSPQARQAARALASAGEVADAADLDAAITAALNTPSRSSSRLALNLIV